MEGRMRKYYEEVVLLEQIYVHDGETQVQGDREAARTGAQADGFVRFQVGEGIEKAEGDFADEVAADGGH